MHISTSIIGETKKMDIECSNSIFGSAAVDVLLNCYKSLTTFCFLAHNRSNLKNLYFLLLNYLTQKVFMKKGIKLFLIHSKKQKLHIFFNVLVV